MVGVWVGAAVDLGVCVVSLCPGGLAQAFLFFRFRSGSEACDPVPVEHSTVRSLWVHVLLLVLVRTQERLCFGIECSPVVGRYMPMYILHYNIKTLAEMLISGFRKKLPFTTIPEYCLNSKGKKKKKKPPLIASSNTTKRVCESSSP